MTRRRLLPRELLDQPLHRRRQSDVRGGAGEMPAPLAGVGNSVAVVAADLDQDRMDVEPEVGEPVRDRGQRGDRDGSDAEARPAGGLDIGRGVAL